MENPYITAEHTENLLPLVGYRANNDANRANNDADRANNDADRANNVVRIMYRNITAGINSPSLLTVGENNVLFGRNTIATSTSNTSYAEKILGKFLNVLKKIDGFVIPTTVTINNKSTRDIVFIEFEGDSALIVILSSYGFYRNFMFDENNILYSDLDPIPEKSEYQTIYYTYISSTSIYDAFKIFQVGYTYHIKCDSKKIEISDITIILKSKKYIRDALDKIASIDNDINDRISSLESMMEMLWYAPPGVGGPGYMDAKAQYDIHCKEQNHKK